MFEFEENLIEDTPYVVLDTETTGLHTALGHRVIEFGAIRFEKGEAVAQFSSLINPGRPIEATAIAVTGLHDEDVRDAPPFGELLRPIADILDGALLVAHNATFDADFLGNEFNLLDHRVENPWLCTLSLARQYFHFGRNSLAHIAAKLNIPMMRAHRALNDVKVTAEVFKRMVRELESKQKFKTSGDLLYAQGGAIYAPMRSESVQLPPLLSTALSHKQDVNIRYVSKVGTINSRRITPRYATQHGDTTYLIAFCHLRNQQRTFRVDRIMGADLITD